MPSRPSLLALARQADESHQRRRFEAILHLHCISDTHGRTGGSYPEAGCNTDPTNESAAALIRSIQIPQ